MFKIEASVTSVKDLSALTLSGHLNANHVSCWPEFFWLSTDIKIDT